MVGRWVEWGFSGWLKPNGAMRRGIRKTLENPSLAHYEREVQVEPERAGLAIGFCLLAMGVAS